jgi:chemotaxis response regulator CheB
MPKDPKRNIQNYQIEGGHLNEFEFQKRQNGMATDSELPFSEEGEKPDPRQRIAQVTAEAHRKVEKRKRRGVAQAGGKKTNTSSKGSVKKVTRKFAKKETKRATIKKGVSAGGKRAVQKVAKKSAEKKIRSARPKKRTGA